MKLKIAAARRGGKLSGEVGSFCFSCLYSHQRNKVEPEEFLEGNDKIKGILAAPPKATPPRNSRPY